MSYYKMSQACTYHQGVEDVPSLDPKPWKHGTEAELNARMAEFRRERKERKRLIEDHQQNANPKGNLMHINDTAQTSNTRCSKRIAWTPFSIILFTTFTMFSGVLGCARVCSGVLACARVCSRVLGCARVCTELRRVERMSATALNVFEFFCTKPIRRSA
jgi:hypothetical protein